MLPRSRRISAERDLARVFRKGKKVDSAHTRIFIAKGVERHTRFAAVIKAGLFRKATERNRWKRKLREAGRIVIESVRPPADLIVFFKKAPKKNLTSQELTAELLEAMQR